MEIGSRAPSSAAHVTSKRPSTTVAEEKLRRKQMMETMRLADATVIVLDQLEAEHAMTPDAVGDNIGFITPVLDMRDVQSRTMLHLVAQSGNTETIALPLKRGANVTLRCNGGGWALMHAVRRNHIDAAVCLQKAATAAKDVWRESRLAGQVAISFASPAMRAALSNADPECRPEPAAVAGSLRRYAPHDDL